MTAGFDGMSRALVRRFLVHILAAVLIMSLHSAASTQQTVLDSLLALVGKAQACGNKNLQTCKNLPAQIRRDFDQFRGSASDPDLFSVAFALGSVLRDASKKNAGNELNSAFGQQAIEYFKIAAGVASKAKDFSQQAAALNEAIYLYRALGGITSDGKHNFGPKENLKGLIPLTESALAALEGQHVNSFSIGVVKLELAHLYFDTLESDKAEVFFRSAIQAITNADIRGPSKKDSDLLKQAQYQHLYDAYLAFYELKMGNSDYDSAVGLLNEFLQFLTKSNNPAGETELLNRIGMHYYYASNPTMALSFLTKADKLAASLDPRAISSIRDNIASAYSQLGKMDEAIAANRSAYQVLSKSLRPPDPGDEDLQKMQNNFGAMLQKKGEYEKSVAIFSDVLASKLKSEKSGCFSCGIQYFNIANARIKQFNENHSPQILADAMKNAKLSLQTVLDGAGRDTGPTADAYSQLAQVHFASKDYRSALQAADTSLDIYRVLFTRGNQGRSQYVKAAKYAAFFKIGALSRLATADATNFDGSFMTAQTVVWSQAAEAYRQFSDRLLLANPDWSKLLRQKQDAAARREALAGELNNATVAAKNLKDDPKLAAVRSEIARVDQEMEAISRELTRQSPVFAESNFPEAVAADEIKGRISDNDALVMVISGDDESFVWVVTRQGTKWYRVDLSLKDVDEKVHALRCGLDEEEWIGIERPYQCTQVLGLKEKPAAKQPLPFNLQISHELFLKFFDRAMPLISGKRLLVISSGPLSSLPLAVLVTAKPPAALPGTYRGYDNISWLGSGSPFVVLPSVSSFRSLGHPAQKSSAGRSYTGFGNPTLSGACLRPNIRQTCAPATTFAANDTAREASRGSSAARGLRSAGDIIGDGVRTAALAAAIRSLCGLPDTAFEIQCVAKMVGASGADLHLGPDATKATLQGLNDSGSLAQYRIIHFATHGLLASESIRIGAAQAEPALVLTPPSSPKSATDNGLLLASEIAQLTLNADWVILSACNTAAGSGLGAEALSGLARSFFYAGARSLLVSHWPVYSDAAVDLIQTMFAEIEASGSVSRAEALKRSMDRLRNDRSQEDNSHPAVWAPFALIGSP